MVTITITGANDAPVAVADGNGGDAVTESGIDNGDPAVQALRRQTLQTPR